MRQPPSDQQWGGSYFTTPSIAMIEIICPHDSVKLR